VTQSTRTVVSRFLHRFLYVGSQVKLAAGNLFGNSWAFGASVGLFVWSWIVNRLVPSANPQIDKMVREARAEFRQKQKGLRAELGAIGAQDGIRQLDQFREKRAILIDVLEEQFASDDLNTDRYLAVCESIRGGLISNLGSRVNIHKAVAHVNVDTLKQDLALARQAEDYDHAEVASLEERIAHVGQAERNTGLLTAANEEALAALDTAIFELSTVDMSAGVSFGSLEAAIAKMEHLVAQAHRSSASAMGA